MSPQRVQTCEQAPVVGSALCSSLGSSFPIIPVVTANQNCLPFPTHTDIPCLCLMQPIFLYQILLLDLEDSSALPRIRCLTVCTWLHRALISSFVKWEVKHSTLGVAKGAICRGAEAPAPEQWLNETLVTLALFCGYYRHNPHFCWEAFPYLPIPKWITSLYYALTFLLPFYIFLSLTWYMIC